MKFAAAGETESMGEDEWEAETRVYERVDEPVPPRRRPTLWPWLLALLLLVLGGLAAAWLLTREEDSDEAPATTVARVEVPPLVGLVEDRAHERLEEAGLQGEVERLASAKPKGVVLQQAPEAGERLERGGVVRFVVSAGRSRAGSTTPTAPSTTATQARTVRVPEVVGMASSDATDVLREAGFDVRLVPVTSNERTGTVVGQNPSAGAEAPEGSEVRLNVAQEPVPVAVPDVVGLELADAARAFAQEGLRAAVRYVPSDEAQGGVVAQAQPAGTERRRGDTVQLNVSTGAEPEAAASVPGVIGQRLEQARQALERTGFEVLALRLDGEVRREDRVATQSPAGGASVPRGSLVLLYVTS